MTTTAHTRARAEDGMSENRIMMRECEFAGRPLSVIEVEGRPHWIAEQIGEGLGYAPEVLAGLIRREWRDEFVEGQNFRIARGENLPELGLPKGTEDTDRDTEISAMLLSKSGLFLVACLTEKPARHALRSWLRCQMLPLAAHKGHSASGRGETNDRWQTAAELAAEWGLSVREIVLIAARAGLLGDPSVVRSAKADA